MFHYIFSLQTSRFSQKTITFVRDIFHYMFILHVLVIATVLIFCTLQSKKLETSRKFPYHFLSRSLLFYLAQNSPKVLELSEHKKCHQKETHAGKDNKIIQF